MTYVGFSAGATAGVLLIYFPPDQSMNISNYINRFIGLSGVYCFSSLTSKTDDTMEQCCILNQEKILPSERNISSLPKIPALLIEGDRDAYDKYPGTGKTHMECLKKILKANGVYVRTLVFKGYGHAGPIIKVRERDPEIISIIQEFLKMNNCSYVRYGHENIEEFVFQTVSHRHKFEILYRYCISNA